MAEIRIPNDFWGETENREGIVANWFYRNGGEVEAGDTIAEVMVEKATYEITAPKSGRLTIEVPKDGVVGPGTVLGRVDGD